MFLCLQLLQDELFDLMVKNFDEVYSGNRAPYPIFLHAPWFTFVSAYCTHC